MYTDHGVATSRTIAASVPTKRFSWTVESPNRLAILTSSGARAAVMIANPPSAAASCQVKSDLVLAWPPHGATTDDDSAPASPAVRTSLEIPTINPPAVRGSPVQPACRENYYGLRTTPA